MTSSSRKQMYSGYVVKTTPMPKPAEPVLRAPTTRPEPPPPRFQRFAIDPLSEFFPDTESIRNINPFM